MNNRRVFIFSIVIVVFIGLLIVNEYRWRYDEGDAIHVTLLTEAKYGVEWEQVIAGANQAANEYGIELKLLAPDYARTYDEQLNLLEAAKSQGTDGIILSPIDAHAIGDQIINTVDSGIEVLSIVKDMNHLGRIQFIGSDQYLLGQSLGKLIISEYGTKGVVSVLSIGNRYAYMTEREQGLRAYLAGYPDLFVTETYTSVDDVYSAANVASGIELKEQPDIIVGLNMKMTLGAAESAAKNAMQTEIYGIDISEGIINHMDRGIIKGVVTQNYFSIGYLSVQEMANRISENDPISSIEIEPYLVTPENLYSKKSQMVLFTIE